MFSAVSTCSPALQRGLQPHTVEHIMYPLYLSSVAQANYLSLRISNSDRRGRRGGMMADFTDLQIQFRLAKKLPSDGTQSTHEVLATVDGSGSWRGESTIDYGQLAEAEQDPRQYGTRLGEFLFNPAIMNALRQARGLQERPVR